MGGGEWYFYIAEDMLHLVYGDEFTGINHVHQAVMCFGNYISILDAMGVDNETYIAF